MEATLTFVAVGPDNRKIMGQRVRSNDRRLIVDRVLLVVRRHPHILSRATIPLGLRQILFADNKRISHRLRGPMSLIILANRSSRDNVTNSGQTSYVWHLATETTVDLDRGSGIAKTYACR